MFSARTALSLMDRLDSTGPRRVPPTLASREGITQSAMTALVDRLKEHRLGRARRRPSQHHLAVRVLLHRDAGHERLLRPPRQIRTRRIAERLAVLDPEDQRALLAALPALTHLTADIEAAPPAPTGDPVHA